MQGTAAHQPRADGGLSRAGGRGGEQQSESTRVCVEALAEGRSVGARETAAKSESKGSGWSNGGTDANPDGETVGGGEIWNSVLDPRESDTYQTPQWGSGVRSGACSVGLGSRGVEPHLQAQLHYRLAVGSCHISQPPCTPVSLLPKSSGYSDQRSAGRRLSTGDRR